MSKLLRLKAMQEHIDNEVINKTSIIQESSKLESQEAGNPAIKQYKPKVEIPNLKPEMGKPETKIDTLKHLNITDKKPSKLETQEAGNPANTIKADKIRSKKTFEVDPDIAGILKFIKFSQKIDESKFVNTALENQIQLLLGDNWRESFKSYLNNR